MKGFLYSREVIVKEHNYKDEWPIPSMKSDMYQSFLRESNASISGKMGKLMLRRERWKRLMFHQWIKWGKIGVSAMGIMVFQQREKWCFSNEENGKILLKGSEREWIMIRSEMAMFPKPKA